MQTQTPTKVADLQFDEAAHVYRLAGRIIPSVTQVLCDNGFINKDRYPEEARVRGSRVHLLCQFFDENDYDAKEAERFGLAGYVESWRKRLVQLGAEVLDIERLMADHTYLFGGRPDRRVIIKGRQWVLDIKSGGAEYWHAYQDGAYARLYAANGEPGPFRRAGVYLKADGSLADFIEHDNPFDAGYFMAFLTTTHRRREYGLTDPAVIARD